MFDSKRTIGIQTKTHFKMKAHIFLILASLTTIFALAQNVDLSDPNAGKFGFFEVRGHSGMHIYSGQNLAKELTNGYGSIELRYGWQTKGSQDWQKAYAYPAFGIGWYSGYIGYPDIFGNPNALYGFASFPLQRDKRHVFLIEPALGLTYNLIPFDPQTNAMNDAIGARLAVYFSLNFGGKWKLNREIDLLYGLDFSHFSNGRTATPNFGLNMFGLNVGARYHFNRHQKRVDASLNPVTLLAVRPTLTDYQRPTKLNKSHFRLYQAIGTVQNDRDAGTYNRYITTSTVLEYQFRFSEMHAVYFGGDLFYDGSVADTLTHPEYNSLQTAIFTGGHVGYEFSFWQIGIGLQFGVYLSEAARIYKDSNLWLRPNIKWDFSKHVYTQVGLKTFNGAAADWVEFGIGFRI
jgi:hypothetical protein